MAVNAFNYYVYTSYPESKTTRIDTRSIGDCLIATTFKFDEEPDSYLTVLEVLGIPGHDNGVELFRQYHQEPESDKVISELLTYVYHGLLDAINFGTKRTDKNHMRIAQRCVLDHFDSHLRRYDLKFRVDRQDSFESSDGFVCTQRVISERRHGCCEYTYQMDVKNKSTGVTRSLRWDAVNTDTLPMFSCNDIHRRHTKEIDRLFQDLEKSTD